MAPMWKVIGGIKAGGILVRTDASLKSFETSPSRLSTGAIIQKLELQGQRLKFRLVEGTGPQEGWVSLTLKAKPLVEKTNYMLPESFNALNYEETGVSNPIICHTDYINNGGDGAERVPSSLQSRLPVDTSELHVPESARSNDAPSFSQARWADPNACATLCNLMLDDHHYSLGSKRCPLPHCVYTQAVAPFLRFDEPLPNMLYVFGGRNERGGPLDQVEMFDTWQGTWVPCSPMPKRRGGCAAAVLPDDRILISGGYDELGISSGILASCHIYDPRTRRWCTDSAKSMLCPRWGHGCAVLGGKVYAVGGCALKQGMEPDDLNIETLRSCEVYDPEKNTWSPCKGMHVDRSGARVVALDDRYLVAVGGCSRVLGAQEVLDTVELYDSYEDCWSVPDDRLTQPRTTAAAAFVDGSKLLIAGGSEGQDGTRSAEVYRVALGSKSESSSQHRRSLSHDDLVDMPSEPRMGSQAALMNLPSPSSAYPMSSQKSIVILGGAYASNFFSDVVVFDVLSGKWRSDSPVPPMPTERIAAAVCVGVGRVMRST